MDAHKIQGCSNREHSPDLPCLLIIPYWRTPALCTNSTTNLRQPDAKLLLSGFLSSLIAQIPT